MGLNTGLQAFAAGLDAANGVKHDDAYWDMAYQSNIEIIKAFKEDSYLFRFKYDRQQEIEADILAYRFCEAMGLGAYTYIMALQLLDEGDPYLSASAEDDHPPLAFRLGLLKYLYKMEHS